jgi:hypothetical protein
MIYIVELDFSPVYNEFVRAAGSLLNHLNDYLHKF